VAAADRSDCERHVTAVCGAVAGDDWVALRRVLHPAVRFTDPQRRTTRGRTKVIALLRTLESLDEPDVVELRDGRVGVWTCTPE
jgi:limonene-1,2-epoxide hydrolase